MFIVSVPVCSDGRKTKQLLEIQIPPELHFVDLMCVTEKMWEKKLFLGMKIACKNFMWISSKIISFQNLPVVERGGRQEVLY